jgi:hypothetical protein
MSRRGLKQKPSLTKIEPRARVSPDDVQMLFIERDRLVALDTRTDAQRWLGDPPAWRSALAQRDRR